MPRNERPREVGLDGKLFVPTFKRLAAVAAKVRRYARDVFRRHDIKAAIVIALRRRRGRPRDGWRRKRRCFGRRFGSCCVLCLVWRVALECEKRLLGNACGVPFVQVSLPPRTARMVREVVLTPAFPGRPRASPPPTEQVFWFRRPPRTGASLRELLAVIAFEGAPIGFQSVWTKQPAPAVDLHAVAGIPP